MKIRFLMQLFGGGGHGGGGGDTVKTSAPGSTAAATIDSENAGTSTIREKLLAARKKGQKATNVSGGNALAQAFGAVTGKTNLGA